MAKRTTSKASAKSKSADRTKTPAKTKSAAKSKASGRGKAPANAASAPNRLSMALQDVALSNSANLGKVIAARHFAAADLAPTLRTTFAEKPADARRLAEA